MISGYEFHRRTGGGRNETKCPCTGNDAPETNTWLNLQKIGCAVIWNYFQL
jgi:hypothetical protein